MKARPARALDTSLRTTGPSDWDCLDQGFHGILIHREALGCARSAPPAVRVIINSAHFGNPPFLEERTVSVPLVDAIPTRPPTVADDDDFVLRPLPRSRPTSESGTHVIPSARRDAVSPVARPRLVPEPAAPVPVGHHRPVHRQNGAGDVVVPAAHGEVVALPRLWSFDLTEVAEDAGVLRSDTGLIAVIALAGDTAVVTEVTETDLHRRSA